MYRTGFRISRALTEKAAEWLAASAGCLSEPVNLAQPVTRARAEWGNLNTRTPNRGHFDCEGPGHCQYVGPLLHGKA